MRTPDRTIGALSIAQGTLYPDVIESIFFTGDSRSPSRVTTTSPV